MTRFGLVLGAQALLLGCGVAAAAPLDQDACVRFKTELLQLELAGARNNMAKGPDWAKANLSADKLSQIQRLLELDEQLLFRCQGKPLVVLPDSTEGEAAADRGKEAAGTAKPAAADRGKDAAGAAKAATKEVQPPSKAQAKQPAASKGPGPAAVGKAPAAKAVVPDKTAPPVVPPAAPGKPKPKAKPKIDDAYRPPPATSP
jgi:hypothetical protein